MNCGLVPSGAVLSSGLNVMDTSGEAVTVTVTIAGLAADGRR